MSRMVAALLALAVLWMWVRRRSAPADPYALPHRDQYLDSLFAQSLPG